MLIVVFPLKFCMLVRTFTSIITVLTILIIFKDSFKYKPNVAYSNTLDEILGIV